MDAPEVFPEFKVFDLTGATKGALVLLGGLAFGVAFAAAEVVIPTVIDEIKHRLGRS